MSKKHNISWQKRKEVNMSKDDIEQLEYIENWKRKQEEKKRKQDMKKIAIVSKYYSSMMHFKCAFKDLYRCIKECFK